ncbi:hypothetical protein BGAL_0440g00010 [Botrytis galanthina]|uniref:Uncharacterized protein n=1 Tax=Botrytis galanthina TaxID=278940 RepID=A0A4S8QM39_9HELO|nr:hypothetical protein BGAL_0440g00010 [Botrytis galanthina]
MRSTWAIRKRPGAISAKGLSTIQIHITCNAHACPETQNGSFLALRGENAVCCSLAAKFLKWGSLTNSTECGLEVGSFLSLWCAWKCVKMRRGISNVHTNWVLIHGQKRGAHVHQGNTSEGLGPTVVNSTTIDIAARGLCGVEKLPTDQETNINDVNVPRLELGCLPRYDMSKDTGI